MSLYRRIIMGMQKGPKVDINEYCTFIARENGLTVSFSNTGLEYCINGNGKWVTLEANANTPAINSGQTISFRGNISSASQSTGIGAFSTSKKFDLIGNCMSLIHGDNAQSNNTLLYTSTFKYLFKDTKVVNVSKTFLPATIIEDTCYTGMFQNCVNLITAPELPGDVGIIVTNGDHSSYIGGSCYAYMFAGCTSLVTAPELPSKTVCNGCYSYMFDGCTALKAAPELPATSGDGSYDRMFRGCTSLVTAPSVLPLTVISHSAYYSMFEGCTKLVTAPDIKAVECEGYMNDMRAMFKNCTSLKVPPPRLPAVVSISCCYEMFYDCSSLTSAPALPATTLASDCYSYMFCNCSSLTSAPALPATTLASSCYYNMFAGTKITSAPALPATTLTNYCYTYMFSRCSSLTSAPALPATTLASSCYSNMFSSCTSLTTAPFLPAKQLVSNCYNYMFNGCTALGYVEAAFTTAPGSSYTNSWLSNVKSTGIFVKNANAGWNVTGTSGVPTGWTIQYNTYD